jgi:hypothetical protein
LKSGYRVSIGGLLVVVAIAAAWLATIRSSSAFATGFAAAISLGAFLTAALGGILLRGSVRAFCLGFAIFGLGYSFEMRTAWFIGDLGGVLEGALQQLGVKVIPDVLPRLTASSKPTAFIPTVPGALPRIRMSIKQASIDAFNERREKRSNFVKVGLISIRVLFGMLGGLIGIALVARSRQALDPTPAE